MQVDIKSDPSKPGFVIVTPYGSIDSDNYMDFQKQLEPTLIKATKNILMDFRDVDYISSAGLGVLFSVKKMLVTNGGELYFCNLKPQIKRLFEIVKALPNQKIFNSPQEADRYFYKMMNEEIDKQKKKN